MFLGNSRRRFRNLLISPETQVRYGALFLSLAVVSNVVLTLLATNIYFSWMNGTMEASNTGAIVSSLALCLLAYALIYGFAFLLGLLISHKVLGPTVPIERFIQSLKEGDFKQRLKLRDHDEPRMQEIAAALNSLAAILEKNKNN